MFKPASLCLLLGLPIGLCAAASPSHMPMLATPTSPGLIQSTDLRDWLVSEKYDGVRAYWDGKKLYSRSGYPISIPAAVTRGWPDTPLEGELWSGYGRYSEVAALINRHQASVEDWAKVRFMLFDLPHWPGDFRQRADRLDSLIAASETSNLVPIRQHSGLNQPAIQQLLNQVVSQGGEGLMLHRASALYQFSRSPDLLKLKPHQDGEAVVIAHLPGKGKFSGMLGALLVELEDGRRFRIGTGFSDSERASPPPIGAKVSFRHNGLTTHGLPRFARFMRIRLPE